MAIWRQLNAFVRIRWVQGAGLALVSFGLTLGVLAARTSRDNHERSSYARLAGIRQPGTQLMLLYIGSARCTWCKKPELPGYVEQIADSLNARAAAQGATFGSIGVALDVQKAEGLQHLERILNFDQVSSGGSWINEAMISNVWDRWGAPSATPQLLVIERQLLRDASTTAVTYRIAGQRLVARKVGLREIAAWVDNGAPTPRLGKDERVAR